MSNTFLMIPQSGMKLSDLNKIVGSQNTNAVLNVNSLTRQRDVAAEYKRLCDRIIDTEPEVSWDRKCEILSKFSTDSDVFEYAALQGRDGWKVLSKTLSFIDALALPEGLYLPKTDDILGDGYPVDPVTYKKTMESLSDTGHVDDTLFSDFSSIKASMYSSTHSLLKTPGDAPNVFQYFKIPFGDVVFYSAIADESINIPVYPENGIKDGRGATYDTMPDLLYQYEPWFVYNASGPREVTLDFHMHRQMWSGNEADGKANELIRFCQASLYPKYAGSNVISDTVTLYIKGVPYIHGILSGVAVDWAGPIGNDGFYLEFTMSLTIAEVSTRALSYEVVRSLPLIG